MLLAENRVAKCNICVSENDFENDGSQVWFIAEQLRYYLSRITFAPFDITSNKTDSGIYLCLDTTYADDEFSLAVEDKKITICGGKRGVIYGGYELLEIIGCRFFTPECEKIPTITTLKIDNIQKREKPAFEYRESDYADATRKYKFATMCRLNGASHRIPENMGGNIKYAMNAHSFAWLLPHEKYRDTHPEYFSYCDGRRMIKDVDLWQPCLTNEEILPIVIENVREVLKENPDKKIFSISQNDNLNQCECENCKKSDAEEGSPVGTLIRFVNKIAEILEPEFPDVTFDILAYSYSRPASHLTKPRKNVCIRLCASRTCYAHSFEKCTDRSHATEHPNGKSSVFIEDLAEWSKICDRLYIWDYTSNFPLYPMPFANWRVLKPNLQTLAAYNVKGVFEEANRAENGGVDFNELRTYLISKLLWNPDCNIEQHAKEFMEYYYGDAAKYLGEYINMICDCVEREDYHLYIQEIQRPVYLTNEWFEKYNVLFDKAEAAVSGNGILLSRVQKARLSIRFADVYWNEIIDKGFNENKINEFFTDLRAHNISRLDEWCNIEGTFYGWVRGWNRGVYVNNPMRYQCETVL